MFDLARPLGDPGKIRVAGFIGAITAMCPCGSPKPMTIPVLPGAGGGYQCGRCGTMWTVMKLEYEEPERLTDEQIAAGEKQQRVKVHVEAKGVIPNIVVAGTKVAQ
jgi:hypothetical protein